MYMICLFLQHKYSWNFIVWTNDNICMSNFLYKIFMRILQVNIFSWYFAFFSGSFFYDLKKISSPYSTLADKVVLEHWNWWHHKQYNWCGSTWVVQGLMAMEWPDLVSLFLRSKLDFLRKRGALHCSARSLLGIVPKTTYYSKSSCSVVTVWL